MAAQNSAIKQFAISVGAWTPIIAPIDCSFYIIIGNQDGTAMQRCSDPADSTTSYTMPAGGWYSLIASALGLTGWGGKPSRFPVGSVVTYLKATTGIGPAIVEFIL